MAQPIARHSQAVEHSFGVFGREAIFRLRFVVKSYEELLFPSIGFLADVLNGRSDDVPPVGYSTVQVVAVLEFCFGVQMILGQRLLVGFQRL